MTNYAVRTHAVRSRRPRASHSSGIRHTCLERAKEDVGDELCAGGREKVDGGLHLPRLLHTKLVDEVDLEELNTSKLEPA
jgi:hypothetical protein